jgi:hypothetical protein
MLKAAPRARFVDPRWQYVLAEAGVQIEQKTGKYFGFAEQRPSQRRERLPTDRHSQRRRAAELERDLKIFGLDQVQAASPG